MHFSNVPITGIPDPLQQRFALPVPCFPVSFFHFWDLLCSFFGNVLGTPSETAEAPLFQSGSLGFA